MYSKYTVRDKKKKRNSVKYQFCNFINTAIQQSVFILYYDTHHSIVKL